jgi:hypothetical protein
MDRRLIEVSHTNKEKCVSVFRTATRYGPDDPGTESQWGRDFPFLFRPTPTTTQPPVKWEWVPSWGVRGVKTRGGGDNHSTPVTPRLQMCLSNATGLCPCRGKSWGNLYHEHIYKMFSTNVSKNFTGTVTTYLFKQASIQRGLFHFPLWIFIILLPIRV